MTTTRGVALYVGALLGPGLLVLPGLAAEQAGPASILAWAGLLVVSGLVAVVFAVLGVRHPGAGGVAGYVHLGLGERAGRAVGWCFLAGIVSGAPVVCYLGAQLLGAGPGRTALAAGLLLLAVLAVTLRGVRASATAQLALVGVLVAVVLVAVGGSAPAAEAGNWAPFAPHGWTAIGSAAAVLMLSFVGWEAIAPLTDRFADPGRQLPRVIGVAFAVTAVIYLALAATTVGVLGPAAGSGTAFAALLSHALGAAGPAVAAAAAIVLTLGTANAYLTGGAALARTLTPRPPVRAFPRWFLAAIVVSALVMLPLAGLGRLSISGALIVATSFFLLVYVGCMVSAVRVLRGRSRAAAVPAGAGVVVVLAFGGLAVVPAAIVATVAAAWPSHPRRANPTVVRQDGIPREMAR